MFSIIGIVVVFGSVLAGYLMEHGNIKVLLQPAELIIILGAAIGTVLIANPLHILMKIGGGLAQSFGGSPFDKQWYQVSGIYQAESKFYLLVGRATRRMRVVGARTPREYLDFLTARPNRDAEMRNLLNEITIGETCLFRSLPQIEALRRVVIPSVAEAKKKMAFTKLRFWSAGCSTGEESYTLAMILLEETQAALKGWTFEIVATDLNDRSVAKAQEGVYNDYAVRNVPADFMRKYINKVGSEYRVADAVKSHITFSRLNMLDDSKMLFMRGLDVIFCCNVLIYFDGKSKARTIEHFFNALMPNGYFFLGHSESLYGVSEKFHLVHFPGATAYWKPVEVTTKAVTR